MVTDTLGLLLAAHVVAANIQDRDGAKRALLWIRLDHPGIEKVRADQGFARRLVEWTADQPHRHDHGHPGGTGAHQLPRLAVTSCRSPRPGWR
ncbi:transposase [Streptomyces sp. NPDC058220]|uniref:transposase n=1 Tax=unclassified Streptomyces TaxID=2593676 RepID=UPI003654C366